MPAEPAPAGAGAAEDVVVQVIDAPEGSGSPGSPPGQRPETDEDGGAESAEAAAKVTQYEEMFGQLMELPNWEEIKDYLKTGKAPTAKPTQEDESALDAVMAKITEDPEAKAGLKELFALAADAGRRSAMSDVQPLAKTVNLARLEAAERQGIEEAGLDSRVAGSQEFRKFAKEFERDNPWIKSVRRDDPRQATKLVGEKYKAEMDPSALQNAQDRLAAARDTSLERRGGSSAHPGVGHIPAGAV
ncbi:MAG: hypothetical protein NUW21_04455, partial [Elusimicrobia bacterium]|nr:hypothetical protein [Elusimicrobiota bacterium]